MRNRGYTNQVRAMRNRGYTNQVRAMRNRGYTNQVRAIRNRGYTNQVRLRGLVNFQPAQAGFVCVDAISNRPRYEKSFNPLRRVLFV